MAKQESQRILGIDPGSRTTGFGVLDFVGDEPPARAVVEVAALPKGALVAIEAVGIQS